jgi:hypothetical protein
MTIFFHTSFLNSLQKKTALAFCDKTSFWVMIRKNEIKKTVLN